MKKAQIEFVEAQSRSRNIENAQASTFFHLTERGEEFIQQLLTSLETSESDKAFSITGPHGAGKSSLARFVIDITLPSASQRRKTAISEIAKRPKLFQRFEQVIRKTGDGRKGWIHLAVTANREPVIETIERALELDRDKAIGGDRTERVLDAMKDHVRQGPTLLVVDEFGKNLEYLAEHTSAGDVFVLQRLIEGMRGFSHPFVILTLQHLSQFDYFRHSSDTAKVEWAKVSGRFQDFAFVDSPDESRRLLATLFTKSAATQKMLAESAESTISGLDKIGVKFDPKVMSQLLPLHPITSIVAPHAASVLAQGERTLFDFAIGPTTNSLKSYVRDAVLSPDATLLELPWLYDYFSESQRQAVATAPLAKRWLEIDDRIRSAGSEDFAAIAALKAVGLLNLVTGLEGMRASTELVHIALSTSQRGISLSATKKQLDALAKKGYITFREFAGEWRIWEGSDIDLDSLIGEMRSQIDRSNVVEFLNSEINPDPMVVARPTLEKGTLRLASRRVTEFGLLPEFLDSEAVVLLALDNVLPATDKKADSHAVVIEAGHLGLRIRELAIELQAHQSADRQVRATTSDRVALVELQKRIGLIESQLHAALSSAWEGPVYTFNGADWIDSSRSVQVELSKIVSHRFIQAPRIANEMIARQHPTGQAARARRILAEKMLTNFAEDVLGIEGYGPERAFYIALLKSTGIHRTAERIALAFGAPTSEEWMPAWEALRASFESTRKGKKSFSEVLQPLRLEPFGLKNGPLPILGLAMYFSKIDQVGLYEYGSLVLDFDDAIIERILKNPDNFSIREYGLSSATRAYCVELFQEWTGATSFIDVMLKIFGVFRRLHPYAMVSEAHLSQHAIKLRRALQSAAEPDALFFQEIPKALGLTDVDAMNNEAIEIYVLRVKEILDELNLAYPSLLDRIDEKVRQGLGVLVERGNVSEVFESLKQSQWVASETLARNIVFAGSRSIESEKDWIENLAMVVSGTSPRNWGDDHEASFIETVQFQLGRITRSIGLQDNEVRITVNSGTGEQSFVIGQEQWIKFSGGLGLTSAVVKS